MKTMLILLGILLLAAAGGTTFSNMLIDPVRGCVATDEFTTETGSNTHYTTYLCPYNQVKYVLR